MLQYAPILHICNVNDSKRDLHFDEKCCIFVIEYRGERQNVAFPSFFRQILGKKSQDFVKIIQDLVEISPRKVFTRS